MQNYILRDSSLISLRRLVQCCGMSSSVMSGRKLVVQCEKHCLAWNWFVVFDLSWGRNLQTNGTMKKLRQYEKSYIVPPAMMSFSYFCDITVTYYSTVTTDP